MLQIEVQAWFSEEGTFGQGMSLLARTGEDHATFAKLSPYLKGHFVPESAKGKLQVTLSNWVKRQPVSEQSECPTPAPAAVSAPSVIPTPASNAKVIPDSIAAIKVQAVALHKRHSFVNSQMHQATTDEERLKYATEIMEVIIPTLDAKYDAIRAWEKDGELPSKSVEQDDFKKAVQMMQRKDSLTSRVSRLKGLIKKADGSKQQEYEIELLEKEKELLQLKKELGI